MRKLLILIVAFGMAVTLVSTARFWREREEAGPDTAGLPLEPGDRVLVSGGYYPDPEWLEGTLGHPGTLERFISREGRSPVAFVRTDRHVTASGISGDVLLMKLRYVGATWTSDAIAHIELCEADPEPVPDRSPPRCAWVESHASIRHLGSTRLEGARFRGKSALDGIYKDVPPDNEWASGGTSAGWSSTTL